MKFWGGGGVRVIWRNPDLTGFSLMMASLSEYSSPDIKCLSVSCDNLICTEHALLLSAEDNTRDSDAFFGIREPINYNKKGTYRCLNFKGKGSNKSSTNMTTVSDTF